jgi:hypothetical protein
VLPLNDRKHETTNIGPASRVLWVCS